MKIKFYIERVWCIVVGICGFVLISTIVRAEESNNAKLTKELEVQDAARLAETAGIHETRAWRGFEIAKEGFHDAIDSVQSSRERVHDGVKMHHQDYLAARKAYREALKTLPAARIESLGLEEWLRTSETRYEEAKETQELYRKIAQLQIQQAVDKLTYAAQNLKYAHPNSAQRERTQDSLFESLGEHGSLSQSSSNEKGTRGVEAKTLGLKLSETIWKSSEAASENAASKFIMNKLTVFEKINRDKFQFEKEDYFDDFRDKYEKRTQDKVAETMLKEKRESNIERIARAAERNEEKRGEKEKASVTEVKEEKKVEKAENKDDGKKEDDTKKDDSNGEKKGKDK